MDVVNHRKTDIMITWMGMKVVMGIVSKVSREMDMDITRKGEVLVQLLWAVVVVELAGPDHCPQEVAVPRKFMKV